MPLTRYEIRNEYALADPQLYKQPPNLKDDPEALLEAVAMSGFVGLLRQLGDLAEFASEIFHDLHEEVMTTSARGHGLMTRLQQIEADVPLVERGLLSQTSFSQFLHNGGVDWHTNFRIDQNQITRGDLPRFIMDSYEECRGPPRLFLLDKFDTAGAGACLKRYSDPSFYKSFSETTQIEGQSEKRARKFKRKSAYRKYGETLGSTPTSHPKLHELLSEDKIQTQNGRPPIHHVRLKKRTSSSSLLNSPTGKSYMEKYLVSVSPLSNPPYESPLRLEMEPSNSSGLIQEIHEVHVSSSPVNKSRKREISSAPSPSKQGMVRKQSLDDLNVNIVEKEVLKLSESTPDVKLENIPSTRGMAEDGKEVVGDNKDRKTETSSDGYRSDDINEVENYVDASPTMEREAETEVDERCKGDINVFMDERKGGDSNKHEEREKLEAQCSASMSAGNSYPSDDDNNSLIEGRFSLSYSSPPSKLSKTTPANGDAAAEVHSFTDRVVDSGSYILDHDTDKKNKSQVVVPPKDIEDSATENLSNGGLEIAEVQYSDTAALPDASTDDQPVGVKPGCVVMEAENGISLTTENKPAALGLPLVGIDCPEVENNPVVLPNGSASDLVEDKTPADWVLFNSFSKKEVAGAPLDFFSRTAKSDTSESASTEEAYSHFTHLGSKAIYEVVNGTCHGALGSPSEGTLKLQNGSNSNGDLCLDKPETNEFSTETRQIGKESAVDPTSFNLESHEPSGSELLDNVDDSLCSARGENHLNLSDDTNDLLTLRLSDRESESKQPPLEHLSNSTEGTMPSGSRSPPESGSHSENGFEDSTDQVSEVTHHQPLGNAKPVNPSASFPLADNEKPPQDPLNLKEETVQTCIDPSTTQPATATEMIQQDFPTPEANTLLHLPAQEGENFQQDSVSGTETEPMSKSLKPFRYASLPSETEAIDPQHLQAAALTREDDIPFVGQRVQPHNSLTTPNHGSEHGLVNLEEELMDFEDGIRRTKIPRGPRPPDALIEAVASHDKSRLRKVTERALSQLQPKEDERNSLLEQIRNRSFSLKPAAVTRPSVQGPRTNLKLVAILEKANAIRQALAGSDDDDDEDGWSDS
ncbi:hypothetical protein C5167_014645 [Papaver somniferum]|uniref:Protein SCAR n=1 Tax=Papaver somniferum TaxID=3469 RepID=A0A4Y7J7P1_PAPSO|nr:protein SCAR2-like [Papaver somniferum]RZC55788.1 hypothetical protein C5167_014645 [Papaver somniferum]